MSDYLVAVFSDVHGNAAALQRVIEDARDQAARLALPLRFWCLGDIANGLPGVDTCLLLLDELGTDLQTWLMGNHDLAQLDWWPQRDAEHLWPSRTNRDALRQEAIRYIRDQHEIDLLVADLAWLDLVRLERPALWQRWVSAPTWTPIPDLPGTAVAHGLIVNAAPDHWTNTTTGLLDTKVIDLLEQMATILGEALPAAPRLVLVGHTHLATAFVRRAPHQWDPLVVGSGEGADFRFGDSWYPLDSTQLWVLNVGSAGWQRDGAPNMRGPEAARTAVYALLRIVDGSVSVSFRCPIYDLEEAMKAYQIRGASPQMITRFSEAW